MVQKVGEKIKSTDVKRSQEIAINILVTMMLLP